MQALDVQVEPLAIATMAGVLVAAFLLGGVPWALVVGRQFYGVDPREHGSGNLGATNVFRVLGARAGAATLLLDAAKGAVAVAIAGWLVTPQSYSQLAHDWFQVLAMLAVVLGHSFSPFTGFKGGKGVATSAGALFVLAPLATAIALSVFVLVVAVSRIVSLGSVVAAFIYPMLSLWLYPGNVPLNAIIFVMALLVIVRHQSNIRRIIKGEERKISLSRRGEARSNSGEGDT